MAIRQRVRPLLIRDERLARFLTSNIKLRDERYCSDAIPLHTKNKYDVTLKLNINWLILEEAWEE